MFVALCPPELFALRACRTARQRRSCPQELTLSRTKPSCTSRSKAFRSKCSAASTVKMKGCSNKLSAKLDFPDALSATSTKSFQRKSRFKKLSSQARTSENTRKGARSFANSASAAAAAAAAAAVAAAVAAVAAAAAAALAIAAAALWAVPVPSHGSWIVSHRSHERKQCLDSPYILSHGWGRKHHPRTQAQICFQTCRASLKRAVKHKKLETLLQYHFCRNSVHIYSEALSSVGFIPTVFTALQASPLHASGSDFLRRWHRKYPIALASR